MARQPRKPSASANQRMERVNKILKEGTLDYDIFKLRRAGNDYEDISTILGRRGINVTPDACHKRVKKVIENIKTNMAETIEDVRSVEISMLNDLQTRLMGVVDKKRGKSREQSMMFAVDRILKINEAKRKLLGLNQEAIEHKGNLAVRIYEGVPTDDVE